jgi:hypothetical protein
LTIVEKLSSVRIITAASLVISVPVMPIAIRSRVGIEDRGGPGEELIGRSLDEAADHFRARFVGHLVERGHQLVSGIKGELGDTRVRLPGRGGVHAALGRQHDQRALGRITDQLAVAEHRVRGQHHRQQELIQRNLGMPGHPGDLPFRRGRAGFTLLRHRILLG